ncbi:hypothetical protein [Anaerosalibacter sp. Marseille-P3206]|nr:hypothetical protein [Anaerosalibacter sp. Marseille-P3206]
MTYPEELIEKVKNMYLAEYTTREISNETGLSIHHIYKILKELNWK